MGFIKIKNVCSSEDTAKKMKRQARDWKKIFVNHIVDKGFVSRICKELSNLNNNNPFFKWLKHLNRYFSNEHIRKTKSEKCQYQQPPGKCKLKRQHDSTTFLLNGGKKSVSAKTRMWRNWNSYTPLMGMQNSLENSLLVA